MRTVALFLTLALTATAGAGILDMPLDSLSPEGYFTVPADMACEVMTEGERTFIFTHNISQGPNGANFDAPVIDFEVYTGSTVNASVAGATLEFDLRYYEEGSGENGEQPYDDGQCELDVTLHDVNGESWTWLDAFDNPEPHGEWFHLALDLADTAGNANFDLTRVSWMNLSGYNSRWCWQDHIDMDSLVIVPEPSTLGLLALGLLGLIRRGR